MGKVIHTGQVVVDLAMRVGWLPPRGGDVFADSMVLSAGGAINAMAAAARDGAQVVYAGPHGTGPFGDMARSAMKAENITWVAQAQPDQDTGVSVAMIDAAAERTFVSAAGAEAKASVTNYQLADAKAGDVVVVSGYTLHHEAGQQALVEWLGTLPSTVQVLFDPSPLVGGLDDASLRAVLARANVVTANRDEAGALSGRMGMVGNIGYADRLAARLATGLGTATVIRAGERGAWLAQPGAAVIHLDTPKTRAVDTTGAGDTHAGVLAAALSRGLELEAAVQRACVAAGLAVTREGPATAPLAEETDAMMDRS